MERTHIPLYTLLALIVVCIVALAIVGIVYGRLPGAADSQEQYMQPRSGLKTLVPPNTPAPTAVDSVSAQRGFQYLVSHDGSGFVPAKLTVRAGETVRFANSGAVPTRVISAGATMNTTACPAADIDSCVSLKTGAYWEHTFYTKGTYRFVGVPGVGTGVIVVQ